MVRRSHADKWASHLPTAACTGSHVRQANGASLMKPLRAAVPAIQLTERCMATGNQGNKAETRAAATRAATRAAATKEASKGVTRRGGSSNRGFASMDPEKAARDRQPRRQGRARERQCPRVHLGRGPRGWPQGRRSQRWRIEAATRAVAPKADKAVSGRRGSRAAVIPQRASKGARRAPLFCKQKRSTDMLAMNYRGPYRVRAAHKAEPEVEHPTMRSSAYALVHLRVGPAPLPRPGSGHARRHDLRP
jgi:hypothetical protein